MSLRLSERIADTSLEEWEDVHSRSVRPSPFLSHRFLFPWTQTFAKDRPLLVVRWEHAGAAEGFLFLCRSADGRQGWEFLGGEEVADSLDAVVSAGSEGRFWNEFLRSAKDLLGEGPLSLPNLVEGSPSLSVLPGVCRELGIAFHLEETDRSPYIPLPGTFSGYLERLGGKERHELRRKIRRSEEAVPGLSLHIPSTPEELARDFPSFVALHRKSHPEKQRFMDDRMAGFFREVAGNFLSVGQLRLAFLRGPHGDIASAFQIETDGALLLYNSGFDPEGMSGRISPGVVLLARCVEDAIRRGLGEYDFLRGRERYKYDLGGKDRVVYRATLRFP